MKASRAIGLLRAEEEGIRQPEEGDRTGIDRNIAGGKLKSIPKYILNDPDVVTLDAYNNRLYHIPRNARMAERLRSLVLRKNAFRAFPRAILFMNNLEALDFREQNVTKGAFAVPDWVKELHRLRDLRLPEVDRQTPRLFLSNGGQTQFARAVTPRSVSTIVMEGPDTVVQPELLMHLMFSIRDREGSLRLTVYSTRKEILSGLVTEEYLMTNPALLRPQEPLSGSKAGFCCDI